MYFTHGHKPFITWSILKHLSFSYCLSTYVIDRHDFWYTFQPVVGTYLLHVFYVFLVHVSTCCRYLLIACFLCFQALRLIETTTTTTSTFAAANTTCGHSYRCFTIVIYNSRSVLTKKCLLDHSRVVVDSKNCLDWSLIRPQYFVQYESFHSNITIF